MHTVGKTYQYTGVWVAISVILLWSISLVLNLLIPVIWDSPISYLRVLLQTHLFTGLFITAHDAMHGAVAPGKPGLNHGLGKLGATLFLFNSYTNMRPKHYAHHRHVGTDEDPDFHNGNPSFFRWYYDFLTEYISWKQILLAAITFNVAKIWIPEANLLMYWVLPSLLSTFQLFYFGTYLPHMGAHDNPHHSRSQSSNHVWAFLSCYFFGYHYEHHDSPNTPWWRLWRLKGIEKRE